ncbi:transcriptional repressor [Labilibaculum sp. A4]|uniref:Fur family transcriptional regulator n=2 Tax=Labilibaculum TaxID=2060722 RepID=UPI000F627E40|nr:transcriptional repressor [Labilibaculum euxinus]MDQ1772997.1 transcriptional repressor [Labilibaculum euxinus]MWN78465.1 transcriptional repressor [Labilibaculum euxinus]
MSAFMKAVDILNRYNLKRTSCREGIIDVITAANQALSENEIREQLVGNYDRTTFYRSFKTLEEHKIIHKIIVDNQLVKYALDNTVTQKDEHAHFYCNECNTVKCMNDVPVQKYQLPDGYSDVETEVLIKGICSNCKNQKNN